MAFAFFFFLSVFSNDRFKISVIHSFWPFY
ncbi:MAG: hypothetical protein ACI9DO_000438 [Reinekea sp.]|jgi:hypothetical protein